MKLELILLKVQNIREHINMLLGEVDAGPLGNNPTSNAMMEVKLSQMVREIATKVIDEKISGHLLSTGRKMMQAATDGLLEGWEDGDDICPPYWHIKWPFPGPQPEPWFFNRLDAVALNPQPLPPVASGNLFTQFGTYGREILLAEAIRMIASLTTDTEFNETLKSAALQIMRSSASGKAYEEFEEKCGSTGPRIPFPPKRRFAYEQ